MEYLIVFSVAAMMITYVWIIGRCLQNAWPDRSGTADVIGHDGPPGR
jgi:hypothetical protein